MWECLSEERFADASDNVPVGFTNITGNTAWT